MIISFTCNNIGTGGAERVITSLANQMARDGHSVRIICYEKLETFYYELEENVSIIELDPLINSRKSAWSRKIAGIKNLYRLYNAIEGTDRVVSFYTRQNCYSIFVCKLRGIPVICAERDHFFMTDGIINHKLRNLFYPHANGFIHQTKMAQSYLREKEGVRCNDVIIPNPLWISEFPKRKPIKNKVIAVGRLADQKNYEGIIRAFSLVVSKRPEAKLHIYGPGEIKKYQNLVNSLAISENVVFEGMNKNIIDVYQEADIYILFSHGEGYPNSLMESLAMGVPSISSDSPVGGPRDMIENGKNGFLVQCGDEKKLAQRIVDLLDDDELKLKFSEEAVAIRKTNQFNAIYEKYMNYIIKGIL